MGAQLGELAADLAGMPMPRPGPFLDGDLTIGSFGDDGLPELVVAHEAAFADWGEDERAGLRAVAEPAQDLLDTTGRYTLVHSDLNPKNVLVDPERLVVTALVDWEFAHAGHPATDLGNLLRFERAPRPRGVRRGGAGGVGHPPTGGPRRGPRDGPGRRPVGAGRPGRPAAGQPGGPAGARPAPGDRADEGPLGVLTRTRRLRPGWTRRVAAA